MNKIIVGSIRLTSTNNACTCSTLSNSNDTIQKAFFSSFSKSSPLAPFLPSSSSPVASNQNQILVKEKGGEGMTQHDLIRLFTHQITAIQIKQFYPIQASIELGKEIAESAHDSMAMSPTTTGTRPTSSNCIHNWKIVTSDRGLETSDVWTMGQYIPYNVAVATNQLDAYFDGVQLDLKSRRRKRRTKEKQQQQEEEEKPYLWPLDQFRLELDEIWRHGATLARDKNSGRIMGAGLPRIMFGPTRFKKGFIHADQYSPLSSENGLFSANIYLQLPSSSSSSTATTATKDGELHIWPLDIRSDFDWLTHQDLLQGMTVQDAEKQIKLRKALGDPLVVHVTPGDLVLLCVQRPHAAVGFLKGTRVSLQCFIQYHGLNERLLIDI